MSSTLVIALDIGTSSVRALAFDEQGNGVGQPAQITYDQSTTPDGGVETGAEALLELLALCLDDLLARVPGQIVAVGISCFWHSLLAVDRAGKPLTGVLSWADNRSAPWIPQLRAMMDETEVHQRTGCVQHTSYWPSKLLWLHDSHPEVVAEAQQWMGLGEYVALKWCGSTSMGFSMASGTGLFQQETCTWDSQVMALLPLGEEQLPPLVDAAEPLPALRRDLLARWPRLSGVPWFPALGDGACSNLGSGCADATKIGLNAGTSGALRIVLPDHHQGPPRGLWRYRIDGRRSIVGGALSNAGNVLAWARNTFQIPENWQQLVAQLPPCGHGLTVLPFLAGERAPLWNGNARFVLAGASLDTDAAQIIRAILEGAALRFAAVGNLLLREAPGAQIVFSGGALDKVPVWQQIICDALGAPLLESQETEASARGAAVMALESAGVIADAAQVPFHAGHCLQPNPGNHQIYVEALQRQNALYESTYGHAEGTLTKNH